MKRIILVLFILLCPVVCFAQGGLINENQIAPVMVNVAAGEPLTAGKVVSLINESGTMKAYNQSLPVNTSPNGSEYVFNSATTTYCSAVALDSTRFIVSFKDSDASCRAIVGTVSGSSVSWGSKSSAIKTNTNWCPIAKVATDKCVIFWTDPSVPKAGVTVVSISGNAITVNSSADVYTGTNTLYNSITSLDTDKAIVCYASNDAGTNGRSKVISVSGTTPTANTEATFNAATTTYISVSALSSTSAIVAYQDVGNSYYGTAQILSISGTTITPGTEYVFNSAGTSRTKSCAMSATSAIIIYADTGDSTYGNAVGCSISGTEISYGAETAFYNTASLEENAIAKIDGNRAFLTYMGGGGIGYTKTITISGTTLGFTTAYTYNSGGYPYYVECCYLGSNKSAVVYQDYGNSSYGTAVVNTWGTPNYTNIRGISQGSYSAGQTASVMLKGVDSNQSGLISGSEYYLQSDFTIGTTPVGLLNTISTAPSHTREVLIGRAKSATELRLDINYK